MFWDRDHLRGERVKQFFQKRLDLSKTKYIHNWGVLIGRTQVKKRQLKDPAHICYDLRIQALQPICNYCLLNH